jgi:SAM-dependent methyltransferase
MPDDGVLVARARETGELTGPLDDALPPDRMAATPQVDPGSFRDPSGFVYRRDGTLYRQINRSFAAAWDDLVASGLLEALQAKRILVSHEDVSNDQAADPARAHAVIRPEPVDFVSYPYEWSFGQLQDAALLTLDAQIAAADAGFTLRDATAYNVQLHQGRPILIDTLSFERAEPGAPWIAYRQFCEHFLAPLALMAHRDVRLGLMLRDHIDGIPLDLAATLLPGRTRLNTGLLSHVHLHARAQRQYADRAEESARAASKRTMSPLRQRALLDSLRRTVAGLQWKPEGTEWAEYAENTSYGDAATVRKDELVRGQLDAAGGRVVWDLGANTGRFSRIAAGLGRRVVAWDIDPAATERHWRLVKRDGTTDVLPLVLDLGNPSPGLGWANAERRSVIDRSDADVVLALALVHHLAISRNVPLDRLADFFASIAPGLVIEFVPKDDPMVRRLLATREDVFPDYTLDGFRAAFARRFEIAEEAPIEGVTRVLFRMTRRG